MPAPKIELRQPKGGGDPDDPSAAPAADGVTKPPAEGASTPEAEDTETPAGAPPRRPSEAVLSPLSPTEASASVGGINVAGPAEKRDGGKWLAAAGAGLFGLLGALVAIVAIIALAGPGGCGQEATSVVSAPSPEPVEQAAAAPAPTTDPLRVTASVRCPENAGWCWIEPGGNWAYQVYASPVLGRPATGGDGYVVLRTTSAETPLWAECLTFVGGDNTLAEERAADPDNGVKPCPALTRQALTIPPS